MTPTAPGEWVDRYRSWGWCVIRARGKRPIGGWKQFQQRLPTSAEWAETRRWAEEGGEVCLVCGAVSGGVAVVDLDSERAVERFRDALGAAWEKIPRAHTPSGGYHLYTCASVPSPGNRSLAGEWDLRAEGGIVVLPAGRGDRVWEVDVPEGGSLPPFTSVESLLAVPSGAAPGAGGPVVWEHESPLAELLARPPVEGGRNNWLTTVCGHHARAAGSGDRAEYDRRVRADAARLEPPLPDSEVAKTGASIWKTEMARRAADAERVGAAGEFFDGKRRFIPKALGDRLAAETPIASGGNQLYTFRSGAYRADGEDDLRPRIVHLLGDCWSAGRRRETLQYLLDSSPRLWETPPLDRVNVANGILDLRTRALGPHSADFLSPVQIPVAYDPGACCPVIDAFLEEVLPADTVPVFHELAGYLITPDNSLQKAIMFLGPGGTGKSTALRVITELLGSENVSSATLHQLEENRFATADLYGKLANIFGDLDARSLNTSSVFKSVVGGDRIRAEHKGVRAFDFWSYARLIFSANATPPTRDASQAYFDRWLVLPFDRRFRGTDREDRGLVGKLTAPAELSGLLNHGVAALERARSRGFSSTAATEAAATKFREEADTVAGFAAEQCEFVPGARVGRRGMYVAYREWCEANGRLAVSRQHFGGRLRAFADMGGHPLEEGKDARGDRRWEHVRLRPTPFR